MNPAPQSDDQTIKANLENLLRELEQLGQAKGAELHPDTRPPSIVRRAK